MRLLSKVIAITALHFPLQLLAECSDAHCRSEVADDTLSLMQVKQSVDYGSNRQADGVTQSKLTNDAKVPDVDPEAEADAETDAIAGAVAGGESDGPDGIPDDIAKQLQNAINEYGGGSLPGIAMPPNDKSSVDFPKATASDQLMQSQKAQIAKDLRVLSYNLCAKCQSATAMGSGKVASIHCQPSSTDPSQVITSCSANVLKYIQAWHQAQPLDVVTFQELCNPAVNSVETIKWGGFDQSKPDKAECDVALYEQMKVILDDNRPDDQQFVFVLNQQRSSESTQHLLIGYKKSTFKDFSKPIIVRTSVTAGRPMLALIFEKTSSAKREKVMILGLKNIRFRKALINPSVVLSLDGKEDPTGLLTYARDNYKLVGGRCSEESLLTDRPTCFSMDYFPTQALSKLFGGFVEKRIREALDDQATLDGITRVIMAGDFQDETGELFDLPVFRDNVGANVRIEAHKRKRTCCSDMDERWLSEYTKWWAMTPKENKDPDDAALQTLMSDGAWATKDSYTDHAQATWDYLQTACKYSSNKTVISSTSLYGNGYAAVNSEILSHAEPHSRYPFPSDLILDSAGVKGFGFPPDYKQALGTETMSDHDPVIAVLPPL
jgi:hypothetical protein